MTLLIDNRVRIEVFGGWSADSSCQYDETALCRLDDDYYALTTSGCSCPSPSETWCIDFGPATFVEMRTWVAMSAHADVLLPLLDAASPTAAPAA